MENESEDLFKSITASSVLVAILKTVKFVEVPQETFLTAADGYTELVVSYDDETQNFKFSLKEENE